tara:strand:+ start:217 stop:630 length:414 start_codon:yes stop_codon:yes gene_type:complete
MKTALAVLLALTPVSALASPIYKDYQPGYSASKTCFREEYREEYVPGTVDNPGYVRSWKETVEFPCKRYYRSDEPRESTVTRTYEEYDTNDCSDGKIAGGLLGGGLGAAISRGDGRWWAIPLGAVVGSHIGCEAAGG